MEQTKQNKKPIYICVSYVKHAYLDPVRYIFNQELLLKTVALQGLSLNIHVFPGMPHVALES